MKRPSPTNPFQADRVDDAASFRPEWDVPSVNEGISRRVEEVIEQVRGRAGLDAAQKIPGLLSSPGYGKSHLFGRLGHRHGDDTLFVFLPPIIDARRPAAHVQWHLVETLFQPGVGAVSPLSRALSRLLAPSFQSYAKALPAA